MSATLPHEVLEMTHKFMTDPVRILVKRDELTLEVSARFLLYVCVVCARACVCARERERVSSLVKRDELMLEVGEWA